MKIPFKITSFLYIFICSNNIYAQSFSKNDKIIEAGFGLGIYDSKIYQKSTNNSETNKAAAWVYPFSVEYAVANRLAIGVGYKYSSFIMGNEDTVNTNAKVSGNDIVLKPTFHLLKTKRINMYVGALAGLAWFNFQVNDTNQSFAKGNGSLLAFREAPPRIRIVLPAPGAPPLEVICTPAALPAINCSGVEICPF